ncbi:MFS transporter [Subtercola sp. YIM 133946]|uniref:MFS transporter n=1 Tax=Subtercola sp. YIM 133946 TaxID=3118909 RepID=UPI002F9269E1
MSSPLGTVLRTRGTIYLLGTSLVGRLPTAMAALAIVQLVRLQGGGYTLAGTMTAAYIVAGAFGQPLLSRRIDRVGQTLVLLISAVVSAAAFVCLALLAAPVPVLGLLCAVVAGVFTPPLEPSLRTLWPRMLGEGRTLKAAFSLDAGAQEILFIVGPLLTVLGIAWFGSTGDVVFAGLLGLAGAVAFAVHPVSQGAGRPVAAPPGEARLPEAGRPVAAEAGSGASGGVARGGAGGHPSPLRNRQFVRILVFTFGVGIPVGVLTIAVTVFEDQHAAPGFAGWALAANAFGALIGATVLAVRPLRAAPQRAMWVCGLLLAAVYVPLAVGSAGAGYYLVAAVVSGLLLPPTLTQIFETVEQVSARSGLTEANAWVVSAINLGIAFGTLGAGAVANTHGTYTITVVVGVAVLVTAGLALLVRPRRLGVAGA